MFIANNNFTLLPESYLFSEVGRRIRDFKQTNPERDIIRMDIGDVSLPLPEVVVRAMTDAINEMGKSETFHGYGPEQGYSFLRDKIAATDYALRGLTHIGADDIFISDGAKSDLGNLGNLFGRNLKIAIPDPGYPVYSDANIMDGNGGEEHNGLFSNIIKINSDTQNNFLPIIPERAVDVIYLCFPNNPTGVGITRSQLTQWVEYALQHKSLIIYDSAYEAYVRNPETLRSIYEIDGAEKVAIEIRSFSKTAGFTGVRCGYTVVPESLDFNFSNGDKANLNKMWNRRQCTKFNGVGYIVQKGAEALYTAEGQQAIKSNTDYYMNNARMLREALIKKGMIVYGGEDSPYVWFRTEKGSDSWDMFDALLHQTGISSTPGIGFGKQGSGFLRLTGFNTTEMTRKAISRLNESLIDL